MRIVLIHRYFWPDTPLYATLLRDIALRLGDEGHQVTVLTCQPSYNREAGATAPRVEHLPPNVTIRRWAVLRDRTSSIAKAINLVTFCVWVLGSRFRNGRVDVVMAASYPPIGEAMVGQILARASKARFVYHKQDIYPEIAVVTGLMAPGPVQRLLRALDSGTDRRADWVVVLSSDMVGTEVKRGLDVDRVAVINNFDPWPDIGGFHWPPSSPPGGSSDALDTEPLRLVFAGNLGRFQGLQTLLEAARLVDGDVNVIFDFIGDGVLRTELEATAQADQLKNVVFHGYRSPQDVVEHLHRYGAIGIVSLEAGVIRAAFPSKTMTYLKSACPILAIVEADSELCRQLSVAEAGVHAEPGDAQAVAVLVRELEGDRCRIRTMREAAARLYQESLLPKERLDDWSRLFATMLPPDGPAR